MSDRYVVVVSLEAHLLHIHPLVCFSFQGAVRSHLPLSLRLCNTASCRWKGLLLGTQPGPILSPLIWELSLEMAEKGSRLPFPSPTECGLCHWADSDADIYGQKCQKGRLCMHENCLVSKLLCPSFSSSCKGQG